MPDARRFGPAGLFGPRKRCFGPKFLDHSAQLDVPAHLVVLDVSDQIFHQYSAQVSLDLRFLEDNELTSYFNFNYFKLILIF